MCRLEASVASTIYRLNLALAAIIAFVFLAEPINTSKIFGLIFACSAIFCFAQHQQKIDSKGLWMMMLVVVASTMRAVYGICYKIALVNGVQYLWLLSGPGLGWIVLGLIISLNCKDSIVPTSNLLRGVLSGFLLCGLVFFFAKALKQGQASIIIPVSQMSFIVTAVLAWLFLGEKPSARKIFGLALACLSIFILSRSN
jgi:drug/metabolite transporter (DMT)-like permease